MNRRLGICLFGLLLVTAVASVGAVAVPTDQQVGDRPQPQTTPENFDGTLFRITVFENASAQWTIQHSRPLANESEIDQFEDFAAEFRQENTSTYTDFQRRARNLVAFGEDVTGRSMDARLFTKDASIRELGQTRGAIEMSFLWTAFGRTEGDRVTVGDIFQGGMYVGPGQRLQIDRGPSIAFTDDGVDPTPDSMAVQGDLSASESVTWVGEVQFADQRPRASLAPRGAVGDGGDGSTDGGDEQSTDGGGVDATEPGPQQNEDDDSGVMPIVLGGGVILLALAGGLAWYAGYVPAGGGTVLERQSTDVDADETGANPSGDGPGGGSGAATAAQVPQEELLSDEDCVLALLDENGGRMKQVAIVEETEWSKSKVSMLLSDMEEAGQISKLRLGRENIISLAGQEPEAAGSPFEDE